MQTGGYHPPVLLISLFAETEVSLCFSVFEHVAELLAVIDRELSYFSAAVHDFASASFGNVYLRGRGIEQHNISHIRAGVFGQLRLGVYTEFFAHVHVVLTCASHFHRSFGADD